MKRLLWLLVIAGAVYSVNEVRTHGLEGAFGGVLAGQLDPIEPGGSLTAEDPAFE
jgi:hypothetical protein